MQTSCTVYVSQGVLPSVYAIPLQVEDFDPVAGILTTPLSSVPLQASSRYGFLIVTLRSYFWSREDITIDDQRENETTWSLKFCLQLIS
jgi:hypothetical protein